MTELRGGARKAASCLLALSVLMGVALPTAAADEAGDGNPAAAASGAGAVGLTYTEFLQRQRWNWTPISWLPAAVTLR